MAEPTVADVADYTKGRLAADDDRTAWLLAAALAAARGYCGWHVTPSRTETITVDGSGGNLLLLPTLRLTALTAITEDDVELDVDTVRWSSDGRLRKHHVRCHRWTHHYQGVTVTITHGIDDAPDWNTAVLSMVDRMSTSGDLDANLVEKTVDDVTYRWAQRLSHPEEALLDQYRLEPGTAPGTPAGGS